MRKFSILTHGSNRGLYLSLAVCMLPLLAVHPVFAAPATAAKVEDSTTQQPSGEGEGASSTMDAEIAALEARASKLQADLDELLKLEVAAQEGTTELQLKTVQDRIAAARKFQGALQRHLSALREYRDLRERRSDATESISRFQQLEEPPPYALAFLDQLIDAIKSRRIDVEAEQVSLNASKDRADIEREEIADVKASLNRTAEQLRTAGEQERPAIEFEVETAKLLVQAAEAESQAAETEVTRAETALEILELDLELAIKKADLARKQTLFRQQELDEIHARQQAAVDELAGEVEKTLKEIEAIKGGQPGLEQSVQQTPDPGAQRRAKHEVTLARMRLEAAESKLTILESLQNLEKGLGQLWDLRFQMHNPETAKKELDWSRILNVLRERLDLFNKEREAGEQRANSLRGQITALETNLREWGGENGEKRFIEEQLNILSERTLLRNRVQMRMEQAATIAERFIEEARSRQSERPLLETIREYGKKTYDVVTLAFDREITEIGGESISGRKLFYMLLILVSGVLISRMVTSYIQRYALRRLKLRSNGVLIIAKLTYYVSFILVVYLALNYVNIPLTIFAFLGGAIALGVGFGAQNLINNFLSGLILMGEQPIRMGDIVEIDGKLGVITNIGARASSLRMFNGFDLLIPNSKFLETSVINWTLSDSKVRLQVDVGVAYGSSTRDVSNLMLRAVTEHGQVLSEPEPKAIFEEFGDSALQFRVYFWIELGPAMDGNVVRSDVRHRIDRLFREAGIVFAYPQQDVHLDTIAPLELRLSRDSAPLDLNNGGE